MSTFIAVIGCGAPELIDMYVKETGCPFPVYADPTQRLYSKLGMIRTLSPGERPAYMQNKSMASTVVSGVLQGLKQVKTGLVLKMGDQRQVGGEFLFEPASASLDTPVSSPIAEVEKSPLELDGDLEGRAPAPGATTTTANGRPVEEKRITWCHRMRTTRDHVEVPELMEVLGLDGDGMPVKDEKRWSKALKQRKGTGLSMASQMSARKSVDSAHLTNGAAAAAAAVPHEVVV